MNKEIEKDRIKAAKDIKAAALIFNETIIKGQRLGLSMRFIVKTTPLDNPKDIRKEAMCISHSSDQITAFGVENIKATNEY